MPDNKLGRSYGLRADKRLKASQANVTEPRGSICLGTLIPPSDQGWALYKDVSLESARL